MRVHDRNLTGASAAQTGRTQDTERTERSDSARSAATGSTGGDRVEFSASLSRLSEALSVEGGNRAAKVKALSAMYQSGNYRVDPKALSRSLISEALSETA